MGLENVFGKPEKIEPENNLEVVVSDESKQDNLAADLVNYFVQSLPLNHLWAGDIFKGYKQHLQGFKITPDIVSKVYCILPKNQAEEYYPLQKGTFISALIQTSYNQGFNDFEFEEVNAYYFGAFLKGKTKNRIRIKAEKITGNFTLSYAENCSLTAKEIKGGMALQVAENCIAEITQYKGPVFGWLMTNCKISSPKIATRLK
ncbi:hypothetical protein HY643_00015, partial [Candidatus Woesearchaeota archaeon]|nr:hypothetical protein [Candidatus Woesearchaeota archaeon]